jgi:hypothetical protein
MSWPIYCITFPNVFSESNINSTISLRQLLSCEISSNDLANSVLAIKMLVPAVSRIYPTLCNSFQIAYVRVLLPPDNFSRLWWMNSASSIKSTVIKIFTSLLSKNSVLCSLFLKHLDGSSHLCRDMLVLTCSIGVHNHPCDSNRVGMGYE